MFGYYFTMTYFFYTYNMLTMLTDVQATDTRSFVIDACF